MIILHLSLDYDKKWIDKWFKRDLCICRFENFPKDEVSKLSWVGIHIGSTIQFIGKLDVTKQVLNGQTYRVFLKSLLGFKPIEYTMKNRKEKYDFMNIDNYHNNGRHMVKIGDHIRVVPIFPKM